MENLQHTNQTSLIITMIMIALLIICYLCLKIVQNHHKSDPMYQKRMAERQREERRKAEEDREVDSYFASDTMDYSDDDYDET